MPIIRFAGKDFSLNDNENLLSGLLRNQARVPFSCRAGVCQSCLLKLDRGTMPANSQKNLDQTQIKNKCFLACQSNVNSPLVVSMPKRDEIPARIINLKQTDPTEILLTISLLYPFNGVVGESVHILSHSGIETQLPMLAINTEENTIEFVVARKVGDSFSSWLHEHARAGDQLTISNPVLHDFNRID